MKKTLLVLALALLGASACPFNAYARDNSKEEIGLSLEVGADLVSSYLWRGFNLGGMSLQPSVTVWWQGLYVCGWANIGTDNWAFEELYPELDITIGYDNMGLQVDLTHLYYFGGDPYFPKGGFKPMPVDYEASTTMEAHAGFQLGELIENIPLSIDWYTTIYGADFYLDENNNPKRAWSSYLQVGYDFELPLGMILGARIGVTPWKSSYTGYGEVWKNAKTVGINNIHLRLEREFELSIISLGVWGECMLNCYDLNKHNLTTTLENKADQHLNWRIGGSLYFGCDW